MNPTLARYRRALALPAVVGISLVLLGSGLAVSTANGQLTEATEADIAAATGAYSPSTGLDATAPVPRGGEVGGAGAIEPADRPVSLAPEVSGVVAEVLVVEGDRVVAGQPLVRLRDETSRAELSAAEADSRAAASDLSAARGDAAAAAARAASAKATAERTAALFARDAATADERDRAERTRDADVSAAAAASARVDQAAGRLRAAQAREALATARLAQLELRATAEGEVLQVLVRPGEAATPTAAAVVTGDTRTLRARLDVNERDALNVVVGQRARVRIEGASEDIGGRVVEVARRVGRKNVRTEDPTDRQDARFVETVIELDSAPVVPMGIRVQGYVALAPAAGGAAP